MTAICFLRTNIELLSGATFATLELANALAVQPGFQVHIVSIYGEDMPESGMPDPQSCEDTLSVSYASSMPLASVLSMSATPMLSKGESSVSFFRLNPGTTRLRESFLKGIRAFRAYVREHNIDIVCSVGMSPLYTILFALRGMNVKRVLIEHSSRSNRAEYGYLDDLTFKTVTKRLDAIVTLTDRDRENYLTLYRASPEKVRVIPNWISEQVLADAVPYDTRHKRIITVGRLSKVKGVDLLVKVAALLKNRFPSWRWNLYGDGELLEETESWIRDEGLEDFVILKGSDPEVLKRYHEHSLFVMTSYFEGLPLVLLEARANHLPVVAFDCPTGPREVIDDGVDGFLIPCYEVETMAERLATLMDNEDLRTRFSEASAKQVVKFSKDVILAQWLTLFDDLTKG